MLNFGRNLTRHVRRVISIHSRGYARMQRVLWSTQICLTALIFIWVPSTLRRAWDKGSPVQAQRFRVMTQSWRGMDSEKMLFHMKRSREIPPVWSIEVILKISIWLQVSAPSCGSYYYSFCLLIWPPFESSFSCFVSSPSFLYFCFLCCFFHAHLILSIRSLLFVGIQEHTAHGLSSAKFASKFIWFDSCISTVHEMRQLCSRQVNGIVISFEIQASTMTSQRRCSRADAKVTRNLIWFQHLAQPAVVWERLGGRYKLRSMSPPTNLETSINFHVTHHDHRQLIFPWPGAEEIVSVLQFVVPTCTIQMR